MTPPDREAALAAAGRDIVDGCDEPVIRWQTEPAHVEPCGKPAVGGSKCRDHLPDLAEGKFIVSEGEAVIDGQRGRLMREHPDGPHTEHEMLWHIPSPTTEGDAG